jgi:alcohol dehydrogenase YqhD (iron-dependent ADH family)
MRFARLVALFEKKRDRLRGVLGYPRRADDKMIAAGVAAYKSRDCDFIVGIGGGSPSTAQGLAVGRIFPGSVCALAGKEIEGDFPPVALNPTTAGTGSEATKFTVITDAEKGAKAPSSAGTRCFRSSRLLTRVHPFQHPRSLRHIPAWTR